jgi:hypothetical protein
MTTPVNSRPSFARAGAEGPPASGATSFEATVARAARALDEAVTAPRPSTTADPAALLATQAEIYRHAERLELASRVVDHAVGAVKTILQTRV